MSEAQIGGHSYRFGRLNAKQQLHVARRLASTPLQFLLGDQAGSVSTVMRDRAEAAGMNADDINTALPRLLPTLSLRALGDLSENDCDYVVNTCLAVIQRQSGSNGTQAWADVMNKNTGLVMFQDIGLSDMLELTVHVLRENLGSFFDASPSASLAPSVPVPVSTG